MAVNTDVGLLVDTVGGGAHGNTRYSFIRGDIRRHADLVVVLRAAWMRRPHFVLAMNYVGYISMSQIDAESLLHAIFLIKDRRHLHSATFLKIWETVPTILHRCM